MMGETVCYCPGFVDRERADELFASLLKRVRWQQESLHLYGRHVTVPRLLAWYGDPGVNYRYAGADHRCDGWLPELATLRDRLGRDVCLQSNLVLINRYRHGADYMGWHTDDEPGIAGPIGSLSLGATRRFLIRPPDSARSLRLDLEHGSLLVMDGALRHSLPRTRRPAGERINLTFRWLAGAAA